MILTLPCSTCSAKTEVDIPVNSLISGHHVSWFGKCNHPNTVRMTAFIVTNGRDNLPIEVKACR